MGIDRIEVFCDGSVTNAVMDDPFTSHLGDEFVGRAMVVIPVRDYGLIEQTREGMVTDRGTAASTEVEVFAIRTALRVCRDLSLVRFTVHSDCQRAIGGCGRSPTRPRRSSCSRRRAGTSGSRAAPCGRGCRRTPSGTSRRLGLRGHGLADWARYPRVVASRGGPPRLHAPGDLTDERGSEDGQIACKLLQAVPERRPGSTTNGHLAGQPTPVFRGRLRCAAVAGSLRSRRSWVRIPPGVPPKPFIETDLRPFDDLSLQARPTVIGKHMQAERIPMRACIGHRVVIAANFQETRLRGRGSL